MPATPQVWLSEFNVTNSGVQIEPQVTVLTDGRILVAWEDTTNTTDFRPGTDIIGQLFDPLGNSLGSPFQMNLAVLDDEGEFEIAALPGGGWVLVYEDTDASGTSIDAALFNSTGSVQGSTSFIEGTGDNFNDPTVAVNGNGDIVVAWTNDASTGPTTNYAFYDNPGNTYSNSNWTQQRGTVLLSSIEAAGGGNQTLSVIALSDNNFMLVSNGSDFLGEGIFGRRINSGGGLLGFPFEISGDQSIDNYDHVDAVALTGGGFVATWREDNGTDFDAFFAVYDNLGLTQRGRTGISESGGTDDKNEMSVAALPDGGFVIVWDDDETAEIRGQRYDASGNTVGSEFVITDSSDSAGEFQPEVMALPDGRFAVVWGTTTNFTTSFDIEMAIFDTRDDVIEVLTFEGETYQLGTSGDDEITRVADVVFGYDGADTLRLTDRLALGAGDRFDGGVDGGIDTLDVDFFDSRVYDLRSVMLTNWERIFVTFIGITGEIKLSSAQMDQFLGDTSPEKGIGITQSRPNSFSGLRILVELGAETELDLSTLQTSGFLSFDRFALFGDDDAEHIIGSGETDLISGKGGNDTISGGEGNDTVEGGDDNDLLSGDGGNDRLQGEDGNDTLIGGEGDDYLDGGTGNNTADFSHIGSTAPASSWWDISTTTGEAGAVALRYEDGVLVERDVLVDIQNIIGSGIEDRVSTLDTPDIANRIETRLGNDHVHATLFFGSYFDGGLGKDTFNLHSDETDIGLLDLVAQEISFSGIKVADLKRFENVSVRGAEKIIGSDVANEITATGEAANVIEAGGGNDLVDAGGGDDVALGGDGNDTLNGGSGNDSLVGGTQNDSLNGGLGNDTLVGEKGKDTLHGDDGNDSLLGGGGQDSLFGGDGDDSVMGGVSNDFISGGDGKDTVNGGNNHDTVEGGAGSDRVSGGRRDDVLRGDAGNDTLIGGQGNDDLDGGKNKDTLNGGSGNDTLDGGANQDRLIGGAGADVFVFSVPLIGAPDEITDFQPGTDIIALSAAVFVGLPLGVLDASAFTVGPIATADERISYDAGTGALVYDADGVGGAAAVQFAQLDTGLLVTAGDFVVV